MIATRQNTYLLICRVSFTARIAQTRQLVFSARVIKSDGLSNCLAFTVGARLIRSHTQGAQIARCFVEHEPYLNVCIRDEIKGTNGERISRIECLVGLLC